MGAQVCITAAKALAIEVAASVTINAARKWLSTATKTHGAAPISAAARTSARRKNSPAGPTSTLKQLMFPHRITYRGVRIIRASRPTDSITHHSIFLWHIRARTTQSTIPTIQTDPTKNPISNKKKINRRSSPRSKNFRRRTHTLTRNRHHKLTRIDRRKGMRSTTLYTRKIKTQSETARKVKSRSRRKTSRSIRVIMELQLRAATRHGSSSTHMKTTSGGGTNTCGTPYSSGRAEAPATAMAMQALHVAWAFVARIAFMVSRYHNHRVSKSGSQVLLVFYRIRRICPQHLPRAPPPILRGQSS